MCFLTMVGACAAASASECAASGAGCPAEDPSEVAEAALLQARVVHSVAAEKRGDSERKPSWWSVMRSSKKLKNDGLDGIAKEEDGLFPQVQMDPPATVRVPRKVLASGYAREVLFKFPLGSNSAIEISDDGKTARIDLDRFMEGRFSRDDVAPTRAYSDEDLLTNPHEHLDYGIEKAVAFKGASSAISKKIKLGFAEKSHSTWVHYDLLQYSETQAKEDEASQTASIKAQAKLRRESRHKYLSQLAMITGNQILSAGKDFVHLEAVRNYTQDHRTPDAAARQDLKNANIVLQRRRELANDSAPIRSSIGCLHFEDAELMNFTDDLFVSVPLDMQLTAWRGQLGFSPNQWYSMSLGIGTFSHNAEDDSLEIYFRFSSAVELADSVADYRGLFSVGPVNGVSPPVGPDARKGGKLMARATPLWNKAKSIPVDYAFLHQNREAVGCPDEVLHSLPPRVADIQSCLDHPKTGEVNMFNCAFLWMPTLLDEINCAVGYLRPIENSTAIEFGRLAAVGLSHVLMEMPGPTMVTAFADGEAWNTYSLS